MCDFTRATRASAEEPGTARRPTRSKNDDLRRSPRKEKRMSDLLSDESTAPNAAESLSRGIASGLQMSLNLLSDLIL
jgi:hypothetical protein